MSEMEKQPIEELTKRQASGINSTDTLLVVDNRAGQASEGAYQIPVNEFKEYVAGDAKRFLPPTHGTVGQLLRSTGDGGSEWGDAASPEEIAEAVTDWLDENVPTGQTLVVDESLTIEGAAADSKVTGEKIIAAEDAITDLRKEMFSAPINYTGITVGSSWTTGSGVDVQTGGNVSDSDYCRTGFIKIESTTYIHLDSETYDFNVWEYASNNVGSAIFAPKGAYNGKDVFVTFDQNATYFRIGARRKDLAHIQASDITALTGAIKTYATTDPTLLIAGAAADAKAVGDYNKGAVKSNSLVINAGTYSANLPDANDVTDNIVYRLNFAFGSTGIPLHLPITTWICRNIGSLYSYVTAVGSHSAGDYQVFITSENIWTRVYTNAWQSWYTIGQFTKSPESIQTVVGAGNYATLFPSANDITTNSIYRLNFANGVTTIPTGLPFSVWKSDRVALLITIVSNVGIHSAGDMQMFLTSENVWIRNYLANAWSGWNCIKGGKEYTVDINGSGDYTSLYACIVEAMQYRNSIIRVKKGTYNVVNELKTLKGDNYFTNFDYARDAVLLDNGLHIIGEPGVLITASFAEPVANVSNYFSPFDIRFDCTLENLEIHAKNCRYCIHDDQWDRTTPYTHTFKNLKLICDNSENTLWTRRLAFGGGLGTCGHIEFDDCYFESVGLDGTAYSGYGSMGYHNSPAQGKSDIIVNNCYFAGDSTFRLTYMGDYSNMTTAYVAGCSFGRDPEISKERVEDSIVNVEIVECNNVVRGDIVKLRDDLNDYNSTDVLHNAVRKDRTTGGILFKWNEDGSCTVTGSNTTTVICNMYNGDVPAWLEKGKPYYVNYSSNAVQFRVYDNTNATNILISTYFDNAVLVIPESCNSVLFGLRLPANNTVNETVNPVILSALSNSDIADRVMELEYIIPSYFNTIIDDKKQTITNNMATAGRSGLSLIHITDTHVTANSRNSEKLIYNILKDTRLKYILHNGDIVGSYTDSQQSCMDQLREGISKFRLNGKRMFVNIGNHDYNFVKNNISHPERIIDQSQIYASIMADMLDVVYYQPGKYHWYYIDQASNTAIIGFQTGYNYSTYGVLAEDMSPLTALINSLSVDNIILTAHMIFSKDNETDLYTNLNNNNYTQIRAAIDASTNAAKVKCILTGHNHYDYSVIDNGLLVVSTTTDSFLQDSSYQGTVNELAFDVCTFDFNNNKLYMTRIGRGNDRLLDM